MKATRRYRSATLNFFVGLFGGYFIATWLQLTIFTLIPCPDMVLQEKRSSLETIQRQGDGNDLIFVGVMTARKFLDSRAIAIYRTWGKNLQGGLAFFSSEGSQSSYDIPVVALPGVDDSYPPQKKSFMMFKYMYDNFIDKYEWFMRADDDAYVKGYKLEAFLRKINSSETVFIGQPGLGEKEEFGKMRLGENDNFCMGGTGMILSQATLRKMGPHIGYCLKHLYSPHEDVEIGRCVKKFAKVDCTWSYEMVELLYHDMDEANNAFYRGNMRNPSVHKAITLHPIKKTPYLYRVHGYLESLRALDLQDQTLRLYRDLKRTERLLWVPNELASPVEVSRLGLPPSLLKARPTSHRQRPLVWSFFTSLSVSSMYMDNPQVGIDRALRETLNLEVMAVVDKLNYKREERGRFIKFKSILYGYSRLQPRYGVDYMLDLQLEYHRFIDEKMEEPVRRHIYLHQAFTRIQFMEESRASLPVFIPDRAGRDQHTLNTIHLVLPLAGRVDTFRRFMANLEETCLHPGQDVKLLVVLFKEKDSGIGAGPELQPADQQILDILSQYQQRYGTHYELRFIKAEGDFSRGLALKLGASYYPPDALLFFVDVDMNLTPEFLQRCRLNTVLGRQVYYPSVFGQYDPRVVRGSSVKHPTIEYRLGAFRDYGYGLVCLYNGDNNAVGGMDTSIVGWGLEDVDLYDKFCSSNLTVFRAADVGLIHIHHPVTCDPNLKPDRFKMCLGSKSDTFASRKQLARTLEERSMNADDKKG